MAPSRIMRQRAISSLRSMMVEATSRGDEPPSTMMLMRPWSWSRTCSALVHSDAPLRFAEVAVVGVGGGGATPRGEFGVGGGRATGTPFGRPLPGGGGAGCFAFVFGAWPKHPAPGQKS